MFAPICRPPRSPRSPHIAIEFQRISHSGTPCVGGKFTLTMSALCFPLTPFHSYIIHLFGAHQGHRHYHHHRYYNRYIIIIIFKLKALQMKMSEQKLKNRKHKTKGTTESERTLERNELHGTERMERN